MERCVFIGGGGHGKVLLDAIGLGAALEPIGFVDPNAQAPLSKLLTHLGDDSKLREIFSSGVRSCVIAVGDLPATNIAEKLTKQAQKIGFTIESVIHPSAIIAKEVSLGAGVQICAGVIIQTGTKIHDGAMVNTGARIDHDCTIGTFARVAPGAILCGGVSVGANAYIGAGAVVIQSVSVAESAIVGAGAVVAGSISATGTYVGIPAKLKK